MNGPSHESAREQANHCLRNTARTSVAAGSRGLHIYLTIVMGRRSLKLAGRRLKNAGGSPDLWSDDAKQVGSKGPFLKPHSNEERNHG